MCKKTRVFIIAGLTLKGNLRETPTWYLSGQSFIKRLKFVSRELDIVAMIIEKNGMCRLALVVSKQTHCKPMSVKLLQSLAQLHFNCMVRMALATTSLLRRQPKQW